MRMNVRSPISAGVMAVKSDESGTMRTGSSWFWGLIFFAALAAVLIPVSLTISAQQESKKQGEAPSAVAPAQSLEEERLSILKADIQKEMAELRKLKEETDATRKAMEKGRQDRLLAVAKMYEVMPAEDAARRIERLDDESALQLLQSLKPKVAGKILAQVEPEKAANLSKKLIRKK